MWHFKKGVQNAIEIITGISFITLLGVCGVEGKLGWIILSILAINTFGGMLLLERFGYYGRK